MSLVSGCTEPPAADPGCSIVLATAELSPGTPVGRFPAGAPPDVSGSRDWDGRIERPASMSASCPPSAAKLTGWGNPAALVGKVG
eukprot:1612040-Rhodomonas_salina.1